MPTVETAMQLVMLAWGMGGGAKVAVPNVEIGHYLQDTA